MHQENAISKRLIPINLLTYQPIHQPIHRLPLPSIPITHLAPSTTHLLYLIFPSHNSSNEREQQTPISCPVRTISRNEPKSLLINIVHMQDCRNKQDKFSNSFPFTSKFQIPNPWPVISAPFPQFQYLQTEKGKCVTC
ncbi:hypothetical protein EYC80_009556 [Monilinia laxa]|uniref:Uncharacterized protein n=1 Tax=Monilinia laxa TaxID=61186 RepID=A0A5N6JY75_MONLA|nr:hypothetical protein EYC80_009556 [Monilinia laxa]